MIDQYSSHATEHRFKNASYYALFMRIRVVRRLERFEKSVSTKETIKCLPVKLSLTNFLTFFSLFKKAMLLKTTIVQSTKTECKLKAFYATIPIFFEILFSCSSIVK